MKAYIKQTKRNTNITINGQRFRTNNDWTNREFTEVFEQDEMRGYDFSCEASNVEDAYQQYIDYKAAFNKEKAANRENKETKFKSILAAPNNYTAIEIWKAVVWLNKQQYVGWQAADIVLADNPLSKRLIEKLGSYTVTTFDDGSLLIKSKGCRYGNKRGWGDVELLLID